MPTSVRAHELETLLDHAPPGIEILSLDCFDTLIWRNTHAPTDVFADLALPGGGIEPRMWGESEARKRAWSKRGLKEIRIEDVYRHMLPGADEAAVSAAVERELAIEARHAFAFAPAVALIREAKRRGLTVIIVSDMYLSEPQLRAHIAAAAGEELVALIDRVFVSAQYGEGKRDGLFDHVLKEMGADPARILHVGDNRRADFQAPRELGIHAVHLIQFDDEAAARLRMEAATALILDPQAGISRPVHQAHRTRVALRASSDPAYALGHDVMGPALHSFSYWLKAELDALSQAAGRPVRPLFVMRDGYLPYRVFDALFPEAGAATVEISRFVALRASISDEEALDKYLEEWIERIPIRSIGRQLMLFENEYAKFLKGDAEAQRKAFVKFLHTPDMQRKIFTRRAGFLKKFIAHLARAGVYPGDAVCLVDIGYNGTVQNFLTPVLREAMNVTLHGRYIFLREKKASGLDKKGMIDVRNYDYRTLHALSRSIVVVEQLCNVEQGSTIDFTAEGEPVREQVDAKAAHNAARGTVQQACLDYALESGLGRVRAPDSDDLDGRCRAAAAALARLFFLPNASEVRVFESFVYDYNMGTSATEMLIDPDRGSQGLRRRGLTFYNDHIPQFMSAELQAQGLPVSLANFAASRFKLDLRSSDFEVGGVPVPAMLVTPRDQAAVRFDAFPTAEGYYRMRIPVGRQRPTVAIQIGQIAEWVQVEELSYTPVSGMVPGKEHDATRAARAITDAMEAAAPGLYRADPAGMLLIPPPEGVDEPYVVSLVFRPVVWRRKAAEAKVKAAA
ncbi:HAD family hydrolase [Sphingomonas canadensis]|uniref:HAD family hydrolase n=1 Tax=Sphingomonas canadensis TaxID=1219257 RepID=A0ABW3H5P2_9SPHN|nr:HAD family hydrolase [Sphingomonas canadensis]MCW3836172.1 hydrolase [Sphingomonas canadensis]